MDHVEDMEIKEESDEEVEENNKNIVPLFPTESKFGGIKNKLIRNAKFQKEKRELKKVTL